MDVTEVAGVNWPSVWVTAGAAAVTAFVGAATAPLVKSWQERRRELVALRLPWVGFSKRRLEGFFFPAHWESYPLRDHLDDEYLVEEPPEELIGLDPHARPFWQWMCRRVDELWSVEAYVREENSHRPDDRLLQVSRRDVERLRDVLEQWGRAARLTGPIALRVREIPFAVRRWWRRLQHWRIMRRPIGW
ncbi:hypothetical protein [Microcella alkaliphila]|uniref:DNA mismatch repair protein MutL n=1 Tax=Microcella alkaliphila TaxID=279828 RepID=A0A0U5BCV9_9MICO|nr:hypothetical protein [Microcella alkaliphila]BAU32481.1 DNA mismatch repair protein MutL [Microcella alkaliphila]